MEDNEYKQMYKIENDHWWFVAKRKFLQIIINNFVANKQTKILDVGCGTGANLDFLQSQGYQADGIDKSEIALSFCRQRGLKVRQSLTNQLDYTDNSFDLVMALDVLEHIANEQETLKEIKRVLKPGGIFVATVPAHQFLWSVHDEALHHFRRYNKKRFLGIFSDNFAIEYISYIHMFILFPAMLLRLVGKIIRRTDKKSDVHHSGKLVNILMGLIYQIEFFIFRLFKKLPFGLSLIIVVRKND